jgi:hypothetical protein
LRLWAINHQKLTEVLARSAVAVGIDKEGRKRYFYRFKNDVW